MEAIIHDLKGFWISLDNDTIFTGLLSIIAITISIFVFIDNSKKTKRNTIESNVFKLLENLNRIIDSMRGFYNGKEFIGRHYMSLIFKQFKQDFRESIDTYIAQRALLYRTHNEDENKSNLKKYSEEGNIKSTDLIYVVEKYEEFYEKHYYNLGHYFRFLYNILKYIESSNISDKKKVFYLGLLQAQMSSDELGFLFYNALSKHGKYENGKGKLFNWLEKYNLLENIDINSIINKKHLSFYPRTEFKLNDKQTLTVANRWFSLLGLKMQIRKFLVF